MVAFMFLSPAGAAPEASEDPADADADGDDADRDDADGDDAAGDDAAGDPAGEELGAEDADAEPVDEGATAADEGAEDDEPGDEAAGVELEPHAASARLPTNVTAASLMDLFTSTSMLFEPGTCVVPGRIAHSEWMQKNDRDVIETRKFNHIVAACCISGRSSRAARHL